MLTALTRGGHGGPKLLKTCCVILECSLIIARASVSNLLLVYLGVLSGLILLIVLKDTAYLATFLSYATQVCSNL